jgi:hypothetical protein
MTCQRFFCLHVYSLFFTVTSKHDKTLQKFQQTFMFPS